VISFFIQSTKRKAQGSFHSPAHSSRAGISLHGFIAASSSQGLLLPLDRSTPLDAKTLENFWPAF
jgi:hypothetical protein